jgi:hypothetical protein
MDLVESIFPAICISFIVVLGTWLIGSSIVSDSDTKNVPHFTQLSQSELVKKENTDYYITETKTTYEFTVKSDNGFLKQITPYDKTYKKFSNTDTPHLETYYVEPDTAHEFFYVKDNRKQYVLVIPEKAVEIKDN